MPSAIVLSHTSIAHELGHLEPWLALHDYSITRVYREDGPAIPDAELLIVLGSPFSVADGHCEPAGLAEIEMVGAWVAQGRPYLGLCFGAQVLALALGGRVERLPEAFVGYVDIPTDDAHASTVGGPWTIWHNDAITAPPTAEVMGSLDHADVAFRVGNAWGLQPHIEVTADSLDRLGIALGAGAEVRQPLVDALRADADANRARAFALLDAFHAETADKDL